jgi:Na+/H+ antiporter NhaA
VLLAILNRCGVRNIAVYMLVGVVLWTAVLKEVINDRQRHQEHFQRRRYPAAEQRQHAERKGDIGGLFLLIGLEVKRELISGELASRDRAIFPVIAALGGRWHRGHQ